MNYKDKFEQSDKKALNSLIATKILDLMDKLRLDANENAQRRWIWELLQNAKDVSFDNQQVETEVFIQDNGVQKSVSFSHNGKPFTVDNITFLIKQVSTKERNANPENEKPKTTGKFGTGFLTTHLLSEKVKVSGVVKEPDLDYRTFILPLDRSGRTPEQIIESVNKSIIVRDTLDSQSPLSNYNPKAFNTSFCYNLEEEGYEVAKVGVEDLHISLPYTLAFLPSIKSVSIKHENTVYELAKIEEESANIQIATIYKKVQSKTQEIKIATLSKNNTTIAVEIEQSNGKTFLKGFADELPKLFCDFPLIGTNDFNLPIVINSSNFNPTEPRDGVWLTDHNNEPKILENKQNIQDSVELYLILLEYASENNWQHLFHLAKTDTPTEKKWFSKSWFETNFQKPIRQNLLVTPIVDTLNGRLAIKNDESCVDFPCHRKKEIREKIWELCNIGNYFVLPIKDEIHEWYEVIWDKNDYLTLETIISWVASQKDLKTLSEQLLKSESQTIEWLNQFYDLISLDDSASNLINQDKYAVILNQNNVFQLKSKLSVDGSIEEELKNALIILGKDWREILVHQDIETREKIVYATKTQDNIIDELNKIIKEGKNENISKACDYLSACFADDTEFPTEQENIYTFCKALWDMPEKKKLQNWSVSIWQEVNKLQINKLIRNVASQKDLKILSEQLLKSESQTIEWLNQFYDLISLDDSASNLINQDKYAIILNQNNVFQFKSKLSVDGSIEEELKNALIILGKDWRKILVHQDIETGEKIVFATKTQDNIIDELNKIIKEGKNENISKACDYLSACFADDTAFPTEQENIYTFCKAIWDMPEKKKLQNWSASIWQEVNKLQIKWLIQTIAEGKNIEKLQESLKLDKKQSLTWLNSFIDFLVANGYDSQLNLKTSPILPNQNGKFCIKDDLFLDNGEIDEALKDILESLDYELRKELLDLSIFLELPKKRERTEGFVADEISKLITPKFAEVPRTDETKQIFKSLYLWFNKHKLLAENLFSLLYANKHKLYDDDEILENINKAEQLTDLLKDNNVSSIAELKELIAKGQSNSANLLPITQEILVSMGISSHEEWAEAIKDKNLAAIFSHKSVPTTDMFFYVQSLIKQAKENIIAQLATLENYDISELDDTTAPTILAGIKKDGQDISIVARPAYQGEVIIHYDSERDILDFEPSELWIDDGIIPRKISLGHILKKAKIIKFPI